MTVHKQRRRPLALALAALTWLGVGLSAPILLNSLDTRSPIDVATVVAAGFDSHIFQAPAVLDAASGVLIRSGRLALTTRSGQALTPELVTSLLKSGSGRLEITRAALQIGGPVTIDPPAVATSEPPIVTQLKSLAFETLQIRDGSLEIFLPGGQSEHLSAATIAITPRRGHHMTVNGTATWRGQRVEIDADISDDRNKDRSRQLRIRLKSALIDTTFEGRLLRNGGMTLNGQSHTQITDARKVAREFGIGWQSTARLTDLRVIGQLNWVDRTIAFEKAKVEVDGHRADGAFTIRTGSRRPLVSGTLAFASLDLARYLAEARADGVRAPSPATAPIWSIDGLLARVEGLVQLPLAQAVDTDLRLSAGELRYGTTRLGRAAASIALRGGQLVAQIAEVEVASGTGSGQLTANFNSVYPRVRLQGRLDKVELAEVASAIISQRPVQGTGTVLFELKADGSNADEFGHSLTGAVEISASEAARLNVDIAQLWTAPPGLDEAASTRLLRSAQRSSMALDTLEVACTISGQTINCTKGEARAGDRLITGTGSLDVNDGRYDTTLIVTRPPTTAAAQGSATGSSAKGATVAVPAAADAAASTGRTILLKSLGTGAESSASIEANVGATTDGRDLPQPGAAAKKPNGT